MIASYAALALLGLVFVGGVAYRLRVSESLSLFVERVREWFG